MSQHSFMFPSTKCIPAVTINEAHFPQDPKRSEGLCPKAHRMCEDENRSPAPWATFRPSRDLRAHVTPAAAFTWWKWGITVNFQIGFWKTDKFDFSKTPGGIFLLVILLWICDVLYSVGIVMFLFLSECLSGVYESKLSETVDVQCHTCVSILAPCLCGISPL